eukprot:5968446-Pyramimonas_sp.AAC.1
MGDGDADMVLPGKRDGETGEEEEERAKRARAPASPQHAAVAPATLAAKGLGKGPAVGMEQVVAISILR